MRFNKLDLNLLVSLDQLLKERSVTNAAKAVNLSVSAMSNSLARLREYFDDELLVQVGRRMELTPRAESLREAVRDVLLRIDTTITTMPAFTPQASSRVFRVIASDYTQMVLGPALMSLAARQHSTVRLEFVPQIKQPQRYLERGEVDLLIVPASFTLPDHPHEVLHEEGFVCMVWRDGSLARGDLSTDRYTSAEHVVMQPEDEQVELHDASFLKRLGVNRRVAVTTYSFAVLPALLVGTERVATVHERVARRLVGGWPLAIRPTPMRFEPMQQAMQWHKFYTKDPGLTWLRSLFSEAARHIDDP